MKDYIVYDFEKITYIKKSISSVGRIYYWANVVGVLKRIAYKYFVQLENKGVGLVVTKTDSISKCLGITNKGLQCFRSVLVPNQYCFQHLKKNFQNDFIDTKKFMQDKKFTFIDFFAGCGGINTGYLKEKQLDQFYTTTNNVTICMQIYKKFITIDKDKDIIIEPSAGCGSFINSINKLCKTQIFIDIDPKHKDIQVGNFLEFNKCLDQFKKVHIIGNPPFSIVSKFIKKASKVADNIGFILPLSFRKDSRKKFFPLNFHCVHEHILLNNEFYFKNSLRKVPTMFQIWEKRGYNRDLPVKIISKYIKFVKKKNLPTLAFTRVGSRCGEISTIIEDKPEGSHYFIKLKNGLSKAKFFDIYKKIKFSHKNTVAQKSISQQELLLELKKYGL